MYSPAIPGCSRPYWKRILAYAVEGGLSDVLDEFFHVALEAGVRNSGAAGLVDALSGGVGLATGFLEISEWRSRRSVLHRERRRMHQHFARRYVSDRSAAAERQASQHLDLVRDAFNSPFWPFVLGTTSVGQEGLDFHRYCHAVVHWNLPSNPVDLEQREGRVHRYHGHAVRKNVAHAVGEEALAAARSAASCGDFLSPWDAAFRTGRREVRRGRRPDSALDIHGGQRADPKVRACSATIERRGEAARTAKLTRHLSDGLRPTQTGGLP